MREKAVKPRREVEEVEEVENGRENRFQEEADPRVAWGLFLLSSFCRTRRDIDGRGSEKGEF